MVEIVVGRVVGAPGRGRGNGAVAGAGLLLSTAEAITQHKKTSAEPKMPPR